MKVNIVLLLIMFVAALGMGYCWGNGVMSERCREIVSNNNPPPAPVIQFVRR